MRHIAHEVVHATTHVDSGVLLLLRKVMYVPGLVAKEYLEGKRKRYFNPFTLLIILIALLVIISNKTNIYGDFTQKMTEFRKEIMLRNAEKSPAARKKVEAAITDLEKSAGEAENVTQKALDNSKIINLIFLPVLSFLTWLFFRSSKYNYAENLILNIVVTCGYTAIFLILIIPLYLIFPLQVILIMHSSIIIMVIFSIAAYQQFYRQSRGWTMLKGIVIQIIYLAVVTALSPVIARSL
jgi:hypothetical protein